MRPPRGSLGKSGDKKATFAASLVGIAACLLAPPPAFAGPPLITDDPDTPGRNQWEINLSYGLTLVPLSALFMP